EPLRRHGLVGLPKRDVPLSEPIANSSMLSLPSITAPWSHRFCVTVDSYVGVNSPRMLEQAVVRTPLVQNRSLMPSGAPSSLPPLPLARLASAVAAIFSALSAVTTT